MQTRPRESPPKYRLQAFRLDAEGGRTETEREHGKLCVGADLWNRSIDMVISAGFRLADMVRKYKHLSS